jgi:hypothetical protein
MGFNYELKLRIMRIAVSRRLNYKVKDNNERMQLFGGKIAGKFQSGTASKQ